VTSIYFAAVQGVARKGAEGELIISGHTGQVVKTDRDYRAYAGLAPDLFAGDAVALNVFRKALWKEKRFEPQAFQSRQNFFAKANVTAIVIEIPSPLIGRGLVHGWATASPYGHAPEVQVSRLGLPLITHVSLRTLTLVNQRSLSRIRDGNCNETGTG
jgi:Domain of unknown function (DUF4331)